MHRTGIVAITALASLTLTNAALAGFPTERFTSYADICIKSPLVRGTLWIDAAGLETIQQFDRDGDFEYAPDELNSARFYLGVYLQRNFLIMWDQQIRPLKLATVDVARRPGSDRPFFRVEFRLTDLRPKQPIAIASRILAELSPEARTYAKIEFDGGTEVCSLGALRYFSNDRAVRPIPADSPFRPDSQRGRIASIGDWSIEMLYAVPEGAFHIYTLDNDQNTPFAIGETALDVSIQPGKEGPNRPMRLTARPQSGDKPGHSSRFSFADPQFSGYATFNADIRIGAGAAMKRVIFEFPRVIIPGPTSRPADITRRGCANLCPGIELQNPTTDKCPRCGGKLMPLTGDTVPGLYMIGAHGGTLVAYGGQGERFEALITPEKELRVYITNERFETLPVKKLTGSAFFSADERFQDSVIEIQARKSSDDRYLSVTLPPTVMLPVHVRWAYNFNEGEGGTHLDILLDEAVPVPQASSQPATSQPSSATATSQPSIPLPVATTQPG